MAHTCGSTTMPLTKKSAHTMPVADVISPVWTALPVVSLACVFLLALWPVVGRGANASAGGSPAALKTEALRTYARIASAVYDDSLAAAESLQGSINAFLDHPSAASLTAARGAWIAARVPYLQSEAFRFCGGPIDPVEGRINAWPVDENYIDYVAGDPRAGIVNHPERCPLLSREAILALNENEGERNISTGFHAIEFLLWGQDHDAKGPGDRSYRDYVAGPDGGAPNPERRCEYLRVVTGLLVDDLRALAKAWADGDPGNHRTWFLACAPSKSLGKMLHGMGALGGVELAGERLTVPYETKEQEDEHSCFSDTTHLDVLFDTIGIRNVYLGRYVRSDGTRVEGPGMDEVLRTADPELEKKLTAQIAASVAAARAIPAPFDQAVTGTDASPGRQAIRRTIQSLQAQSDLIAKAIPLVGMRKSGPGGGE